jgi:predicted alpha/beta superfamily hydrolase
VADAAYDTLMRGAALNMSNMENLEWLSGQPLLLDEKNQADRPGHQFARQLWSVGAYLGMVIENVFGVQTTDDGIALHPFVTAKLRRETFAGSDSVTLNNLTVRGKRMTVRLLLPTTVKDDGYYAVETVTVNGRQAGTLLPWYTLPDAAPSKSVSASWSPASSSNAASAPNRWWKRPPCTRRPNRASSNWNAVLTASRPCRSTAQARVRSTTSTVMASWRHSASARTNGPTAAPSRRITCATRPKRCTPAPATAATTAQRCAWTAVTEIAIARAGWGAPGDTFAQEFKIDRAGSYAVQLKYRNTAQQINLGISGGVKWLSVKDAGGKVMAAGVVQLPHSPADAGPVYSTLVRAMLKPGSYHMVLEDFYNMSYLQSNTTYADAGGVKGTSNKFDIHGVRVMPIPHFDLRPVVAAAPAGEIRIVEQFASPQLGNSRKLRIYLPPGYDAHPEQRYPVLYMHDGQNLFDATAASYGVAWDIGTTMDKLIASGAIAPAIVVGIDNTKDRVAEYTPCCDANNGGGKIDAYMAFIVDTVKPWADANLRTLKDREHTAIMGSSLGGIASVYIAQKHPEVFSKAGGVSSSFWWNDGVFIKNVPPHQPVRFYLDAGTGGDGLEGTQKMRDAMLAKGYRLNEDLYYYEAEGGIHNERSWAARVHLPLTWFFRK